MKAILQLEEIGCGFTELAKRKSKHLCIETERGAFIPGRTPPPCWVKEITETGERFLEGQRDYRTANNSMNRGVYLSVILETGRIYQIRENISNTALRKMDIHSPSYLGKQRKVLRWWMVSTGTGSAKSAKRLRSASKGIYH